MTVNTSSIRSPRIDRCTSVVPWLVGLVVLALVATGCDSIATSGDGESPEETSIPDSFPYQTTAEVAVDLTATAPGGGALAGVPFQVQTPEGGVLKRGATGRDGTARFRVRTAIAETQLVVRTSYPSLPRRTVAPIRDGRATAVLSTPRRSASAAKRAARAHTAKGAYPALGSFDAAGVPTYLAPGRDLLSADLLQTVDASLPEGAPVPDANPEYLASGNQTDLVVTDSAEVWVTFVHEGAGYQNVLGFYTYEAGNPPETTADIDDRTVIFPNVSFPGDGGGLQAGDRVSLGRFGAGTAIGWFLIADGWTGSDIGGGRHIIYSQPSLNPEPRADQRQHSVLLADAESELVLLGFEDQLRTGASDNDFNDAIFYVTANPFSAVETDALPETDSDGGGTTASFSSFMPAEAEYATLAFEDLWPGEGDYDFNDLVVDYNFSAVETQGGAVAELTGTFVTRAIGGSRRSGLAVELPIDASRIVSVAGQDLRAGAVQTRPNGTEAGSDRAVIPIYDDAYNRLDQTGESFRNTVPGSPAVPFDTITVTVAFDIPVPAADLGTPPYNPFIFATSDRGREVHLPDRPPTVKADPSLFGRSGDTTDPGANRFYKTDENLPWALHLPVSFAYSSEKTDVRDAYRQFAPWARSNGTRFRTWYAPANRDPSRIY